MKKVLLGVALVLVLVVVLTLPAKSKIKSYYAGDAINYQGTIVVGSTNSESLEVFKLQDNELVKFVDLKATPNRFSTSDNFFDLKFNQENGHLYVYAISGFAIYKYDISDLSDASLVKKDANTYWEWYNRVDKFGDDIVTVSAKGVKVWNKDLEVIDNYDIKNDTPYNIRSNGSARYIFNITSDEIQIFDRIERKVTKTIQVNYRSATGNHSLYYDSYDNLVYVVDDYSAKKFDLNGALKDRFEHSGNPGYDVASSDNEYIYFSNGIGLVKLDKSTMEPMAWQYTGGINGDQGWAMGLKVVANVTGDKVVVFNNSSILVLDENLKKLAGVRAGEATQEELVAKEKLFLRLNATTAASGNSVLLTGGGFYPNEKINILFGETVISAQADADGRIKETLTVPGVSEEIYIIAALNQGGNAPDVVSQPVDIKVTGAQSALSYSISFNIQNIK
jgi:hypothetical protein